MVKMSHSLLIGFLWLHYIPATWLQSTSRQCVSSALIPPLFVYPKKFPPYSDKKQVAVAYVYIFPFLSWIRPGCFVPAGVFPCGSVLSQHSPGLGVPQTLLVLLSSSFLVTTTTTPPPVFPTTLLPKSQFISR